MLARACLRLGGPLRSAWPCRRSRGLVTLVFVADATSLLPPAVAIALAIGTRQVHLSLFAGIWLGAGLLEGGDPLSGLVRAINSCVAVLGDAGNARVIIFSALVGAVIALTRHSGGVEGFVARLTGAGWVNNRRRAMLLSWSIGLVIFIESSLTALINGAICRPIFDQHRISREKLAYLCDATSAPICVLLPLNGWAAYVIGLLGAGGVESPVGLFVKSIPLNFYAWIAVLAPLIMLWRGWDFGPMKRAEARAMSGEALVVDDVGRNQAPSLSQDESTTIEPGLARDFVIPIVVMVALMPIGLWVTGDGDIMAGSGSTSVLWAVLGACVVAGGMLLARRRTNVGGVMQITFGGIGELMPLAILLMLAFAIGQITRDLGTGAYLAAFVDANLSLALVPTAIFVVACIIAFSTGTSWGTFALMIPIALPLVAGVPEMQALAVAAVLGGGVFGDHCSPISDTTMISSLAAGCDHIDHVRTQLPYALAGGLVAMSCLLIAGAVMT